MAKSKQPLKVPFDGDGNLMDYVSTYSDPSSPPSSKWEDCNEDDVGARKRYYADGFERRVPAGEWRDNYVFHETLTLTGSERGRSAARFTFEDEKGHNYIMFLTDMVDLLTRAETIAYGMIEADWTFQKRGSNYGIRLA